MKKLINLLLVLCITITVSACTKKQPEPVINEGNKEFEELVYKWFVEDNSKDYVNQMFNIKDLSKYGIEKAEATFGPALIEDDDPTYKDRLAELAKFDLSTLNDEQLLAYKCLKFDYENTQKFLDMEDAYDFPFTPGSGDNNNLTTVFVEFMFEEEQDFEDYISLVKDSRRYIGEDIGYLNDQAEKGIIQADFVIDGIIESCERFISKKEDNEVIEIFNKAVDDFGLANAADYKARLKQAVLDYLIPAFEDIINAYRKLYGKATNKGGLKNYPDGRKYYEALFEAKVGTSKSVFDLENEIKSEINRTINNIVDLSNTMDAKLYRQFFNGTYDFGHSEPNDILEYLKSKMVNDFPDIPKVEYTVDYLDESVATDNVVAYYLIARIDDIQHNTIKCNKKYCTEDPNDLCNTLAHEGYPGHLYQNTYYFSRPETLPIRYDLGFTGYSEGWAVYTEKVSKVYFAPEDYANLANYYDDLGYYLYGYLDIMFNYEGWTVDQGARYLANFYDSSYASEIAQDIFETVVGDPGMYLPYSLGYYMMKELREKAETELGKAFNMKAFHKVILDTGAAPYDVLEEEVDKFIKK